MAGHFSGTLLRDIRRRAGLSREQLAVAARLSGSSLAKYEQGKTTPSIDAGAALATILGIQVGDLLDGPQPTGAE